MNEQILIQSGLSADQAKVYLYLLENGLTPAKHIALNTAIGRALTYKVLEQLIGLNLAEKRENIGKIALFAPKHPKNIKEMLDKRKQELEHTSVDFGVVLNTLSSEFNALLGKPNTQSFEGIEGIKKIHEDILSTNENILIVSSPIAHKKREEILDIIKKQLESQVKRNIHCRAITPRSEEQRSRLTETHDTQYLIERKVVPVEKLNIPAQIIVYGDKVAITNFKESIITVVIESKYITQTFRILFEYIWCQN